ncbi:LytR/AlgR family response regulator transcription factor [Rufibacter glacialis]|uniref:Response regulator transcription factor n=1 Tax=Rufibacter glacialis TaxID=1259555 RepID=A0A5M8QJA7_9BACT|nr:LytTR family DNA-binding domain-containing protein [Rufibacter glacialis]KAA6434823.1 response regulator transcription factor [Rufibacter glacialis]GGK72748.1 DNA-binding response regulator [Rufibacter glacialis]
MKAIAIDDEPIALEIIRSHASKVPFLDLRAEFTDAFKALEYLQKEPIDLLFLDIKMPDISGIDFFNSLSKKPLLIFTTAYSEHAVTSFEMDAVDYLLKPFSLSRFIKGCNKAFELYNFRNSSETQDHLYVKTGYEQLKIMFDEILYLEATGNYVTFALKDKNVLSRSTFMEAIQLLPAEKFVRVHRSYVVAVHKIERVERHQVTIHQKTIPLSEAYRQNLTAVLGR